MVILGIVLVLAGAGLMVAEAHLPTAGILGLLGVVSLVAGGAIAVDASGGGVALVVVVTLLLALIAGVTLATVVRGARSVSRAGAKTGAEGLVGRVGVVRRPLDPLGHVVVDGELWRARRSAIEEHEPPPREGEPVVVDRVQGLTLSVRRAEDWEVDHDCPARVPRRRARRGPRPSLRPPSASCASTSARWCSASGA